MQERWSRLPGWLTMGAGFVAVAALALHLVAVLLHPPESVVAPIDIHGGDAAWFALSFSQIQLALGIGLIMVAGGLLSKRFGGLVVATVGLVPILVAAWTWYRNPLAAQLDRAGVSHDSFAANQLAPFFGAGPLSFLALALCGVVVVWVVVVWARLLQSRS